MSGRLSLADLPESQKHPIILPREHYYVTLLIEDKQCKNLHVGPRGLLASLQLQFWFLKSQRVVSNILREYLHGQRKKLRRG